MSAELDLLERDVVQARRRVHDDLANLRRPGVANLKRDLSAGADNVLTDIKDRLSANPVATLAIGAGIAWQLVRRPPIASLLVGYGVISLIRTDPRHPSPLSGYAIQALETGSALAERAKSVAGDVQSAAAERLQAAQETAAQTADTLRSTASQWSDRAAEAASNASDALAQGAATVRERAPQYVQAAQNAAQRDKDTYLLGFAAAALAAAIGISAQRRAH
jgi:ElaB/YqjD/DUF883 family membrane-anchored ribosome-binding protein